MANRRFIDFPIATTVGDSDIILIWQSGVNKQTTKATFLSGLPENLDELNDVAISGLTNGQILRYDSVTGKWENTDQGNLDLNDLNDVSIVSPSNGQVLVYNSSTSKWENSSGGFVPYVGAITTVDLGAQGLRAGYVRFDTTVASVPQEQGLMFWDADDETVDIILNGYTMKIGEDLFYPVKNQTGSTIAKGTAVRFNGTVGASGRLLIAPFIADGSVASNRFMGVTAEEILNGEDGKVLYFGRVRGINTNAFNEGDVLYASTTVAGGFQTAIPAAPNNIVLVAAVVTKSINQGTIFVRPVLASNLNTDEAVKLTSVANLDLLQYQSSTGLWENKTIDGAGIVTTATSQVISGLKTFNVNTLMMQSSGNAKAVYLTNSSGSSTYQSGFNFFGFNTDNHIYFAKSSNTGANTGILAWTNTATRTYTLKDESGTLAFTSDIPANPVGGTGTTNYLPKFTGSTTIGNSNVQDSGSLVTINSETKFQVGANATRNVYFGTSATNYGRITYNDATGELAIGTIENYSTLFVTNNTTKMTLTSSGNLGLGVTPSAWSTSFGIKVIDVGNQGTFYASDNDANISFNQFFNGTNAVYKTTGTASRFALIGNEFQWRQAPSGTAGNAISFTQAMTLNASGNLLVGTTTDNGARLQVSGNVYIARSSNPYLTIDDTGVNSEGGILFKPSGFNSKGGLTINYSTAEQRLFVGEGGNSYFQTFYTNGSERLRITSSGNLGLGVTPSAWGSLFNNSLLQVKTTSMLGFDNNLYLGVNYYATNLSDNYIQNGFASRYVQRIGQHQWETAPSGTANGAVSFTQAMTLTNGGNLLVGTTSDNGARLQVSGDQTINATQTYTLSLNNTAQDVRMQFQVNGTQTFQLSSSSSQVNIFGAANIPMIFYTNSTERMRITSGGNVLIGTSSPSYRLVVNSGTDGISAGVAGSTYGIRFDNGGTFSSGMSTIHGVDSTLVGSYQPIMLNGLDVRFGTSANERMRITSSGEVLINTTTNSATSGVGAKFVSNGRLYTVSSLSDNTQESLSMYSTGAANYRFYVGWGGTIYATSTSISGISDISLKTNIRDLDKGLQDILQLKPRRFDWKNGDGKDNIGFVAQEIESIFPELISEYKYNQFETKKSLKMGDLIPSLVKAIQELKQEIDTLKN